MLRSTPLEDTNLVGDVHSLVLSAHAHKRLLEAQRRDNSVHLVALDVVELVDGLADLSLVRTDIDEEGQNVLRLRITHTLKTNTSIFFMDDSLTAGFLMMA